MTEPTKQHPNLQAFEATLRRHDSATLALEEWCRTRGIADPATITAHTISAASDDPPRSVRSRLRLNHGETLAMRHVRLSCGPTVLSVAWNWYVPSRLTPAMNDALARSDTPFGKVIAPLQFRREPLETIRGQGENCPKGTISTHKALLVLPDDRPLAYLIECYTEANLHPGPIGG